MSRRGIIIVVVAALTVLVLAIWSGKQLGTADAEEQSKAVRAQLVSTESELSRMLSDYSSLQQSNGTLRTQMVSAESELSRLQSRYGTLQQSNAALRGQIASGETELSRLQSDYSALQQKYNTLQSQLTTMTSDYNNLVMRYTALEKTKLFVIDERLKVAVFTEAQIATAAWVRGEVTNTGTTTIPKVYALLFRYNADGSLDKLELPPTVLLNLAPQATGYFSFLSAGENYKILIAGDY